MAGQVSKEEVGTVLMQAMLAAKNLRPQRDRLQHLRRRLQQLNPGDDDKARVKELATNLFKVYFIGMEAGARSLTACLELAAQNGARFALNHSFSVMPDEQLYDALLAQRLPARPTTQTEALSRVEAALYAVKLPQEHHLPRCIEHLIGVRPPHPGAPATGDPPQKAPTSIVDLDKARSYLDGACTLADLAVKHIDLAVVVLSRFMDPKELASLSEFTDTFAYISEDGPYPSSDRVLHLIEAVMR